MKITLSVIKADVGGFVGHSCVHPDLIECAEKSMKNAVRTRKLIDYRVLACGDDLQLIMTHKKGVDNRDIHKLAWDTFIKATAVAKKLKLYGAGQDLLKSTFSGNIKGMGPGVAEMEFEEREAEPVIVFMADKTEPGAWNYPLYKMFADPFNTPGLIIDPNMERGFKFEVYDVREHKRLMLNSPEEMYDLLAFIGTTGRYIVKSVFRKMDDEIGASSSVERLSLIAGKYVGKDDPVLVVRGQHGFPAIGEILEPFAFPHAVAGWMRGSHHGPLMPVSFEDAKPSRFDGPPVVIAAGFQLSEGNLIGPRDMFKGPQFDRARQITNAAADYFRMNGPFEPHRLQMDEMEYTKITDTMEKYKDSWRKID
jgi:fructose 1,6-bisphosphate aldolase/phosphatase